MEIGAHICSNCSRGIPLETHALSYTAQEIGDNWNGTVSKQEEGVRCMLLVRGQRNLEVVLQADLHPKLKTTNFLLVFERELLVPWHEHSLSWPEPT